MAPLSATHLAMERQVRAVLDALGHANAVALHEPVRLADVARRLGRVPLVVLLDLWDQDVFDLWWRSSVCDYE